MRRYALILAALGCAALLPACGVGFGVMADSSQIGKMVSTFDDVPAGKLESQIDVNAPVVTLYDKTGIVLAAVGNASSAWSAQRAAARQAAALGARPGDRFSYRYRVHAPSPGLLTSFSYAWARPTTIKLRKVGAADYQDVKPSRAEFSIIDVQLSIWEPSLARQLSGVLQVGARARKYDLVASNLGTGGIPYEVNGMSFGVPISFRVDHHGLPVVRPWVRVVFDPVFSLLARGLREDDGQQWANYQLQAGVDLPLFYWLAATAWVGKEGGSIDSGKHDVNAVTAQVALTVMFGGK